jgi:hypothetical protein
MSSIVKTIALLLLLTSGCSRTTMREIGEKHKAEIEAVLAEFRSIAESIPQEDFDADKKLLDVEPYLHLADLKSNTALGSRDQFMGVVKRLEDPTYFNMYTFPYEYLLENRFAAQPAKPEYESEITAFIDLRYAIVYHPVDYRDAAIKEKEFLAEPLKLVLAMYDRKNKNWIFRKTFGIQPPNKIEFSYRAGQEKDNAEYAVKSFYIDTVMPQIAQYLEEQIVGTIEFDKEAYRRDGTRYSPF